MGHVAESSDAGVSDFVFVVVNGSTALSVALKSDGLARILDLDTAFGIGDLINRKLFMKKKL